MEKPSFLDLDAPEGYVAGAARGDVGFASISSRKSLLKAPRGPEGVFDDEELKDDTALGADDQKIDDKLSITYVMDDDDKEALQTYRQIEERRLLPKKSDTRIKEASSKTDLSSHFTDLKRSLASVSASEWESLPEVGDLTRKNKRARLLAQQMQRLYAAPDTLIAGSMFDADSVSSVSDSRATIPEPESTLETPVVTDFTSISDARDKLLVNHLDLLVHNSVPLSSQSENQAVIRQQESHAKEISDIEKARMLLKNLRRTQPDDASSWISSARLEEQAGNRKAASSIISEACRRLPRSEHLWLESIRIHETSPAGAKQCKALVAQALQYNRKLEAIWLQAEALENLADVAARRRVLMKALSTIPHSTSLWEHMIKLEPNHEDTRELLLKATELCPTYIPFWQQLIKVSSYSDAKDILNRARKALPGSSLIWLTAAKLEERQKLDTAPVKVRMIMKRAFDEIKSIGDEPRSCREWLEDAMDAEKHGYPITSELVVENALDQDTKKRGNVSVKYWLEEAEYFGVHSRQVANKIYLKIVECFPHDIDVWTSLFATLRAARATKSLYEYYEEAIKSNPDAEILLLMYAKDKWVLDGDTEGARKILQEGNLHFHGSEAVWLARVKVELRSRNAPRAHELFVELVHRYPRMSARIWYKFIHLERHLLHEKSPLVSFESIRDQSEQGRSQFPNCAKLSIQWAQILEFEGRDAQAARNYLSAAIKNNPGYAPFWLLLVKIDQKLSPAMKVRAVLDSALSHLPKSDAIFREKIRFEQQAGDIVNARQWATRGIQRFPASPGVWAQYLEVIPRQSHRKKAFLDALNATNNAASTLVHIGAFFWKESQHAKAQSWFERALLADRTNGDCWGWVYAHVAKKGTSDQVQETLHEFDQAFDDVCRGASWIQITKDALNLCKSPREILILVSELLVTGLR